MRRKPIVHIVHHVDTEGPLYEPLSDLFQRIGEVLGEKIDLLPTKENLRLLQSKEFVFKDEMCDKRLKKLVDPHLIDLKSTWTEIDAMLNKILSVSYRQQFVDSFGGGWIYNWHILDHAGFQTNPRRRDMGYLSIFNYYEEKLKITGSFQDGLHWHFHPVPFNKAANISATSYFNSAYELQQILCRRLIEKKWFPVVNRAGFHTVRPDSNWWLEQWLPFDASNQAMDSDNDSFTDNVYGRFGNWSGAPSDWSLYNPDLYDWRKKGVLKRTIARCLNLNTRFRNITVAEIEKAFELAERTGQDVYLGVTNHDFREMSTEQEAFYVMLLAASAKYPDVNYRFSEAIEAFRNCIGYTTDEALANKLEISTEWSDKTLILRITKGELFGAQPFLAIKTFEGMYLTDNFDFGDINAETFYYTFDSITLPKEHVRKLVIAANDKYGNTCIVDVIDSEAR